MRILMVHPHDIYSALEPWTVRITAIADEFVKAGHDVKLVYFPLPENERGKLRCSEFRSFEAIAFNRGKFSFIKNIIRMYRLSEDAEVIHFQKCFAIASLPAVFSAYLRRKPLHYDWDDWELKIYEFCPPSKLVGVYLNILETLIPRLVNTVSVASSHLESLAIKRGVSRERIFEAHVCADLEKFRPDNDRSKIRKKYNIDSELVLYLGQLHGGQYAELLLKAAKLILFKKPKAKFMIVGSGQDLERLKEAAKELRLGESVIFTGAIEYKSVPDYIAAADIAVACFEDNDITKCKSPLKIVEYMASGKAIVASDVGEVKKMLGGNGILTEPGDVYSLAEGIIKLIENPNMRERLGKEARKRAEAEYRWDVTAGNILKAYKEGMKDFK